MKSFYYTCTVVFFLIATLHVNQVFSSPAPRESEPDEVTQPEEDREPQPHSEPRDEDLYPPQGPTGPRDEDLYTPPSVEHEIQPGCCRFHFC
ncbi:hypothetical protein PGT21_035393 [Puccinia graminis f. sp. tritici]|uniref:Uncharacterized protein n=1 Tax=Puccinia graminis f. sp. tritici TaxID=56615 RepID=A0A5B0M7D2_PUCGR|nr:hypothetical protein PGT21_034495 [Puccinia graminis f. sp. tritici]KAA1078468.1 hypothetical protein PGT21_035393 [Puccinia graminis f. sp. tritici]KAA1120295.1 hypothetical protein PGTUg99_008878 [Puccinia graminis f. sp. tritici]